MLRRNASRCVSLVDRPAPLPRFALAVANPLEAAAMTSTEPVTRRIPVRGLTLSVAEAGPEDGPLTVLLHGFPETWWSWRHQIGPLAAVGLRVVAPDQRGYGL